MAACGPYALAPRYYDRKPFICELFSEQCLHLTEVFRKRIDSAHMCRFGAEPESYLLQFAGALRILATGHAGSEIV